MQRVNLSFYLKNVQFSRHFYVLQQWPSYRIFHKSRECFRAEQTTVNCVRQLSETHHNLISRPMCVCVCVRKRMCIRISIYTYVWDKCACVCFLLSLSLKTTQVWLLIVRQKTCNFTFSGRFVGDKITATCWASIIHNII